MPKGKLNNSKITCVTVGLEPLVARIYVKLSPCTGSASCVRLPVPKLVKLDNKINRCQARCQVPGKTRGKTTHPDNNVITR